MSYPIRRVVVTGIGLVTPIGSGTGLHVWPHLLSNSHSGIQPLPQLSTSASASSAADLPVGLCAPSSVSVERSMHSRFVDLAVLASRSALEDAGMDYKAMEEIERIKSGICIGTGFGSVQEVLEQGAKPYRKMSPYFVPRILGNMPAGVVSMEFGFKGVNHAVSTACAAGAHAVGDAFRWIKEGYAELMLAGGTEASISYVGIAGFARMKALSNVGSRPFDRNRDGFVMGEGAGILVLEELERAKKRNAKILAEVRGYGVSGDAFHITQPDKSGDGARRSMLCAIRNAGLEPRDIDYVNAHATSTPIGDAVEAKAIYEVFGGDRAHRILVSSTKGATGHTLGAAGAIEAAFAAMSCFDGNVPCTMNLEDPHVDTLSETQLQKLDFVMDSARKFPVRFSLTNSFGFGGTNASLIFSKF